MDRKIPIVRVTNEQLKRLWETTPEEYITIAQQNQPLPVMELVYSDTDMHYCIEAGDKKRMTVKGKAIDKTTGRSCEWVYEKHENNTSEFHHPPGYEFDLDQVERIVMSVLSAYLLIQCCLLFPEELVNSSTKKRRGNLSSQNRTGDDTHLYSVLMGYKQRISSTVVSLGKGSQHSHEYDRRGHYRHYKSGKVVFIHSYTCCKGKGTKIQHEYEPIKKER